MGTCFFVFESVVLVLNALSCSAGKSCRICFCGLYIFELFGLGCKHLSNFLVLILSWRFCFGDSSPSLPEVSSFHWHSMFLDKNEVALGIQTFKQFPGADLVLKWFGVSDFVLGSQGLPYLRCSFLSTSHVSGQEKQEGPSFTSLGWLVLVAMGKILRMRPETCSTCYIQDCYWRPCEQLLSLLQCWLGRCLTVSLDRSLDFRSCSGDWGRQKVSKIEKRNIPTTLFSLGFPG